MSAMSATLAAPAQLQPDYAAIKTRQRAAWSSGDYAVVGTTLQIVGETLSEALDLRSGEEVLDVAAGNGNATLAAARRGCRVISTDYVPALLERGRERAAAEHLEVEFREADAEALPYEEARFDVVVSVFGAMFTPEPARAAAEMLRVCRSGGRIGMANWTPDSLIGQLFKTIGRHVPPPPGVESPAMWGTRERIEALFGGHAAAIHTATRQFAFRYRSPQHFLEVFRSWYGPVLKAYAALDADAQAGLTRDILALLARYNRSGDETLVAPSDYLEVVVVKG